MKTLLISLVMVALTGCGAAYEEPRRQQALSPEGAACIEKIRTFSNHLLEANNSLDVTRADVVEAAINLDMPPFIMEAIDEVFATSRGHYSPTEYSNILVGRAISNGFCK